MISGCRVGIGLAARPTEGAAIGAAGAVRLRRGAAALERQPTSLGAARAGALIKR
jgi:TRAP-type mannitol/chloroaromatic compound transport system permease large subunit